MRNIILTAVLSSLFTLLLLAGGLWLVRDYWGPEMASLVTDLTGGQENINIDDENRSANIPEIIAEVNPAVVSVVVTKSVPTYEQYYENFNPFGDWWGSGFSVPRLRENGHEEKEVGGGSGFIVNADGLIVTNHHVVSDVEAKYSVIMNDGKVYPVTVVDSDSTLDLAILQITDNENTIFPFLTLGDSDSLRLGESVIAIGNALAEFRNSVSVGIISGLSRSVTAGNGLGFSEELNQVIQTDAAINPGNSGGPLLNLKGEVIGVNVAMTMGAENIGFALPVDTVKLVVGSIEKYGEIKRPYLGVRYVMINQSLKEKNNLTVDYGALVVRGKTTADLAVIPGSPADKAGLRENDIILAIDSVELKDMDLASVLRKKVSDETIDLKVLSAGKEKNLSITLEATPN